jgi:hypothetical protein
MGEILDEVDFWTMGPKRVSRTSPWSLSLVVPLCFLAFVGLSVLAYISIPMRKAALAETCKSNLRTIGLALRNYHAVYGCFPPAYTTDAHGMPAQSWRVLILPFAGEQALYQAYRTDEPWDGPKNSQLAGRMPAFYRCPAHAQHARTNYAVIVGPETAFPGSGSTSISQIENGDGLFSTMLVAEIGGMGIPWMEPRDLRMVPPREGDREGQWIEDGRTLFEDLSRQGLASRDHHPHGANFLDAAGRVMSLRTRSGRLLHAIFTINGRDPYCIEDQP